VSNAPRRAALAFILVTLLLDTRGLGLIIPVVPRLIGSFVHDDLETASHYYGALVSLFAVMQFIFAPVLGALSDRFGRRPIIFLSLCGYAIANLASGLAPSLFWLFAGRVVAGITAASFSAANAYIADVTPPNERAKAYGIMGAVFGLGFILGPALGGLLGDVGLRVPFFVVAALNTLNLVYGIFVLPESVAPENRRAFSLARANAIGSLRALGRHRIVLGLSGTMLCSFLAQWILQAVWTLYTQARYDWSLRMVGISFMVVGFAMAIVQGGLVRVVVPRMGEPRALVLGLSMNIVGNVLFGLADRGWLLLSFLPVVALGGLAAPAVQAILTREVPASEQGELQGAQSSLQGLAAIVGPLIGTYLLARFGPQTATIHLPGAPFFAAAAINIVGLALAVRLFRSRVSSTA